MKKETPYSAWYHYRTKTIKQYPVRAQYKAALAPIQKLIIDTATKMGVTIRYATAEVFWQKSEMRKSPLIISAGLELIEGNNFIKE